MSSTTTVRTSSWQPSRWRTWAAWLVYPFVLALNRPSLGWFADLIYDVALRCNGIAVTFPGKHGLTHAEENFLRRNQACLQNGILFDVGANHGAYAQSLQIFAPAARIFAFEPHPATFAFLHSRLQPWPSIQCVNKAVADKAGHLKLYDFSSDDGSTQASLSQTAVALFTSDIVEHAVECTTIDDFMAEAGIDHIDFLKIDTEGHDLSVLMGAQRALRDQKIKLIQFEFIPANIATGVTMRRFYEVLQGYRIGRLCVNGSVRWLDTYDVKRCEIYVTHNLIAQPLKRDQIAR